MSINFKKGDLFILEQILVAESGEKMDIRGATAIDFVMKEDGGSTLVRGECFWDDSTSQVWYEFLNGETDVAGMYRAEYEVSFAASGTEDQRTITVPNRGTLWIHIEDDVA